MLASAYDFSARPSSPSLPNTRELFWASVASRISVSCRVLSSICTFLQTHSPPGSSWSGNGSSSLSSSSSFFLLFEAVGFLLSIVLVAPTSLEVCWARTSQPSSLIPKTRPLVTLIWNSWLFPSNGISSILLSLRCSLETVFFLPAIQ